MRELSDATEMQKHERLHDTLTAAGEKFLLSRIVQKLPGWVTPDILTAIGFLGALIILLGYWLTNLSPSYLWLATLGFAINWFGDSLDGTLARHRKIERPRFGYFIDHTVDAVTQLLIAVGLGLSPYVSLKVALFALTGYFLVSIHTYITIHVRGIFRLSYGRLGPTEARLIAVAVNTLIFFKCVPNLRLPVLHLTVLETVFFVCSVVMIVFFLVSTIKQAIELAHLENRNETGL